ncbi:hypothetical protein [Chengkuizengella marina]|uniref:Uncharacterized protein n=1 Tax=Chengkuizengella marina TaxID=2507566 RepID=A0A6N9Q1C0_9BACL|nr:hypothetical protein [Chengkuizengella marina]NBI28603.1 hypothetical protein [Chengkuizengella marina]
MAKKKYKVVNNMPNGALGIVKSDGKSSVLRKPSTFTQLDSEDIWHIFNTCKTIQKGYLYIDSQAMRTELGLEEAEFVDINALSRDDLREYVKGSLDDLKEVFQTNLSDGTREKIVLLAREEYKENSLDAKKMKFIETETGQSIAEVDGSDIKNVNDVKEQKKAKKQTSKKETK